LYFPNPSKYNARYDATHDLELFAHTPLTLFFHNKSVHQQAKLELRKHERKGER